ncbi:hypothetical protein Rhopal_004237-T1 [Rhodotorula paludigena]|uniref:Uncharacterized protein n=1 Tax=Rhodotorula paludigena TaxID=86838 RepID=A0AAV5GPN7_9BASI|nr:hypothetical protein Rhopal_004237-T1 [Rhodotorula paludigena]
MSVEHKNPRLCKTTIDGGFEWTFRFEIDDLDLTDPFLAMKLDFPCPFAGSWNVATKRKDDGVRIEIHHGTLVPGHLGRRVAAHLELGWAAHGRCTLLKSVNYAEGLLPLPKADDPHGIYTGLSIPVTKADLDRAEKASLGGFVAATHRRYVFEVKLEQASLFPTADSHVLARHSTRSPIPHDVRLYFPRAGEDGAEIWTTAELLSNSSPYLKDLLSSDFAESVTASSRKRKRRSTTMTRAASPPAEMDKDHDDSDDELDELFFDRFPRPLFDVEQTPELSYHQIEVKLTAYTTYLAVIRWLETGYIAFLPLTSTCKPRDPSATRTHREEVLDSINKQAGSAHDGTGPLEVSLKSTYRLAHLLQLDRLQQLCLAQLPLSLTHHGVAHELCDSASILYDEWRKVLVDYVVENWDEVTTTTSWTTMKQRVERDEVPGGASVLLQLFEAKMKATMPSTSASHQLLAFSTSSRRNTRLVQMSDERKKPRLRKTTIDGGFDWTFSLDIDDLDLTDPKLDIEQSLDGPLAGQWDVQVWRQDDTVYISICHGRIAVGLLGKRAYTTHSPSPHDVRISFPRAGEDGAEIWTTAELLSKSSPYLKDLLSSDFAESVTASSRKRKRCSMTTARTASAPDELGKDHDDSDDEMDELFFDKFPRPLFDVEQTPELTYHQIEVKMTAYTTYLAVIRWLETGYIAFLPLTSTCKPRDPSATRTHREELLHIIEEDGPANDGKKPLRVSLKSTYRLAHLLQLDRLQQLCLAQLPLSLTHHGVAHELCDSASILYDEWRKVLVDFVVENWDEVTTTTSWTAVKQRVERDEVPGGASVLLQLFEAKMKASMLSTSAPKLSRAFPAPHQLPRFSSSSRIRGATTGTTIDGGFDWRFRFEIDDLDLTDPNIDAELRFDGPLAGSWTIEVSRLEDTIVISICHGAVTVGLLGKRASATLTLGWVANGLRTLLAETIRDEDPLPRVADDGTGAVFTGISLLLQQADIEQAEEASQGVFVASRHRRYSFDVRIEQVPLVPTKLSHELASHLTRSPVPHAVRLFFRNAGKDGAEIWTTAELLSNSSPYLKDLLSSDFAESVTVSPRKRTRRSTTTVRMTSAPNESDKGYDDSDDELDEVLLNKFPRPLFDVEQTPELTYHQIEVKMTAYTTYLAVIRWLETGYIAFLPLASTCKPRDPSATLTHREEILYGFNGQGGPAHNSKKPLRVSLKSTYRLAHLIQLDRLQQLCLAQLQPSLTHHGAAYELFDSASVLYEKWRRVILDYVLENWDEVTTTSAWTEHEARIDRDELPGAAPILQELYKAKMKQAAAKS